MKKLILILFLASQAQAFAADVKPKYGPQATRLYNSHEYIRTYPAPDYWAISPYYVPQRDGASCALATFAMVFNALRADQKLGADDKLITQNSIYEKLNHPAWTRFFANHGKSVSLEEFADIAKKLLVAYAIAPHEVDFEHIDAVTDKTEKKIASILEKNEKSGKDFVIVNFLQSEATGDPDGAVGHVAPVAAYDSVHKKVLIMDPDREYYEPYWVDLKALLKGMNTFDKDAGKNRGLIWIH